MLYIKKCIDGRFKERQVKVVLKVEKDIDNKATAVQSEI